MSVIVMISKFVSFYVRFNIKIYILVGYNLKHMFIFAGSIIVTFVVQSNGVQTSYVLASTIADAINAGTLVLLDENNAPYILQGPVYVGAISSKNKYLNIVCYYT